MTDLTFSDSIVVDTDPETLYGLVADVTNMGRWSPQCKECWWEDEAGGPVAGAWFKGRNEADGRTWETRSQVVVAEPGREFVWEVNGGWVRWGFTLDPVDDGTRLTVLTRFRPNCPGDPMPMPMNSTLSSLMPKGAERTVQQASCSLPVQCD